MSRDDDKTIPELQQQLDQHRSQFIAAAPPHALAAIREATGDLIRSGIAEQALKKGEKAPDFELPNASGENVALSGLLAKGPAVIAFYRGVW